MKKYLFLLLLISCVKREEVEADIWKVDNDGVFRIINCHPRAEKDGLCKIKPDCRNLDKEQCDKLKTYEEFVSWDNPAINSFMAMRREDAEKWLDAIKKKGD